MNPNLEYAQAISGLNTGRGIGIIDTLHLVEPARAATLLATAGVLDGATEIQGWFAEYLEWMRTSEHGKRSATRRTIMEPAGSCRPRSSRALPEITK